MQNNSKTNEYLISTGNNDECYTYEYAVYPLLEFLTPFKDKIIWCPFDTEDSAFVKVFMEYNFKLIFSHIKNGEDFFTFEPARWDLMISNPPFTNKAEIFKRALSFNKPFALLMTILWLNDGAVAKVFKDKKLQILSFDKRMEFKNINSMKKINFMSAYFCWNFLPEGFLFRTFSQQGKLF